MAMNYGNPSGTWSGASNTSGSWMGRNTTGDMTVGSNASGLGAVGNPSVGWAGDAGNMPADYQRRNFYDQGCNTIVDNTILQGFIGTTEFPPLSYQPVTEGKMMAVLLADMNNLEMQTPRQEDAEVKKDVNKILPEAENLIPTGIHQAKHTRAISAELRHILDNEKKILDQIMKRSLQFVLLKDENKRETEKWFNDNRTRLPRYETNLFRLTNSPDDSTDENRVQQSVRQKVLLEIVHKTIDAAKGISVQLLMEDTIVNEMDLCLADLKHHCVVTLKLMDGWTRLLKKHEDFQLKLVDHWEQTRQQIQQLRDKKKREEEEKQMSGRDILSGFDDRLGRLEFAICDLAARAECP